MPTSSNFDTSNQYIKYTILVTQNSQNISNNTSNVTVSVRFFRTNTGSETYGSGTVWCKINGTTYSASVSPSQRITNAGIILFSQTLNVGHNSDGTKNLTTSAWISLNTPLTSSEQSYSQVLTTIPRASSVSGGSANIGSTTTINISRASSSFTHVLYWQQGSSGWNTIAANVGTSYIWTIPASFYARIPNANSGTGIIWCETYSNGVFIGNTSINFTFNVTNSNPIFQENQLTYSDTNSVVTAITNDNQIIVRNRSNLQVSFSAAAAQNSATITKYQVTFGGETQEKTKGGTMNFGPVNSSQDLILQIKAIDSRGNSTTIAKTVTILDWNLPIINASATRINNFENETTLLSNVQISDVGGLNIIELLQYRAKKTSDYEWNSWIDFQNSAPTQIVLNNAFAWELQVKTSDKFGTTVQDLVIPKGMPLLFFDTEKLSVGVNCFPAKSSSLEINGQTIFDMIWPIGSIYLSVNSVNPETFFGGEWIAWGQGRVPVGVASSGTFNTIEKTGGAETHTLTLAQIPPHNHETKISVGGALNGSNFYNFSTSGTTNSPNWNGSLSNNTLGSGESHNNLQPYITCYMWKRTV